MLKYSYSPGGVHPLEASPISCVDSISPRAKSLKRGFICVERFIRSKSSTYSEIFSEIRICASYKNHPVQKYHKKHLDTSIVKIANRNLK